MISLRTYLQLHMDSLYASAFGAGDGPALSLSEVMKTAHLVALASGHGDMAVNQQVVDVSEIQLPDYISARVLFAHIASYYVTVGDTSYTPPDLPSGSGTRQVPNEMMLPPLSELTYLLQVPVRWVPIELPNLEAS